MSRIKNYNGVCTNGFLQPTNNLQLLKQVVKWLVYKGYIRTHTYHIPHTEEMYQISTKKKEMHNFSKTTVMS